MRAIQGGNRNQIEHSQNYINVDSVEEQVDEGILNGLRDVDDPEDQTEDYDDEGEGKG